MIRHKYPRPALLGHVLERLGQALLAEGELSDSPDLGVLEGSVSRQFTHDDQCIPGPYSRVAVE